MVTTSDCYTNAGHLYSQNLTQLTGVTNYFSLGHYITPILYGVYQKFVFSPNHITKEDIFMSIDYEIPPGALYLLVAEVTTHHDRQAERLYALSCHFEFVLTHHNPHGGAARHTARKCKIIGEALGYRIMGSLNLEIFQFIDIIFVLIFTRKRAFQLFDHTIIAIDAVGIWFKLCQKPCSFCIHHITECDHIHFWSHCDSC